MKTKIYYYSGTGNSLWVAGKLSQLFGNADVIHLNKAANTNGDEKAAITGIVFPVYIWGVPAPVLSFIDLFPQLLKSPYTFAVAVNAGQVSNTLVQLKKAMQLKGLFLNSGFDIKMPSNYIPWGGPGPDEKQQMLFKDALTKISLIADIIQKNETLDVEKGPLWQRILFSAIYHLSFPQVPSMDKKFHADEKCTACGICVKVCPAGNIHLDNKKPVWHHHCHQCFACLQWCPERAIEYGKNTRKYERYHQPEIKLKDIIKTP
jgi:ferredoxin